MHTSRMRFAFCLLSAALLGGCATTSSGSTDPLAQANAHFTRTVATGAAAGCVAGAILGALLDSGNRAAGAAMGCGAGGLAGGAGGYAVANNNVAEARTEQGLEAEIANAKQDAAEASRVSAYAQSQADAARTKTAALRQKVRAGEMTDAQYQTSIAGYEHSSKEMKSLIGHIDTKEASYRAAARNAPPAQSEQLNEAADQMGTASASLTESYQTMQQALAARPAA